MKGASTLAVQRTFPAVSLDMMFTIVIDGVSLVMIWSDWDLYTGTSIVLLSPFHPHHCLPECTARIPGKWRRGRESD